MTREDRFEMDPATAEPLRKRVSDELHDYLSARAAGGPGARVALRQRLGVPSLTPTGKAQVARLGADASALYSRFALPLDAGLTVDGMLVVPQGLTAPAPLVVAQHGGAGSPELATFHGGANYHGLVRGAAAAGYVVWAPRLYMPPPGSDGLERPALDRLARVGGSTLIGVELGKLEAALGVLLDDPRVDSGRTAMVGLSIGGQYALLAGALDLRLGVVVSANPVLADGWVHELAPVSELVSLLCPRPLQIQVGTQDAVVPPDVARAVAPHARALYDAAGASKAFEHVESDVGHDFVDDLAWPFVARHLSAPRATRLAPTSRASESA